MLNNQRTWFAECAGRISCTNWSLPLGKRILSIFDFVQKKKRKIFLFVRSQNCSKKVLLQLKKKKEFPNFSKKKIVSFSKLIVLNFYFMFHLIVVACSNYEEPNYINIGSLTILVVFSSKVEKICSTHIQCAICQSKDQRHLKHDI